MANIPLTSTFTICPEGRHIFRIYKVDYNPEFGKLVVHMVNAQGFTHLERFSLMNQNGEMNDKACGAFSFFAKTALNNFGLESIDHSELVNHYIGCEIVHTVVPSTKEAGKTMTFTNTAEKWVADGFDTKPCKKALTLGTEQVAPKQAETPKTDSVDLNSLLN